MTKLKSKQMRILSLEEMERVNGGISCTGGLGFSAGVVAGGFVLVAATGGVGALVVLLGGALGFGAATNCRNKLVKMY